MVYVSASLHLRIAFSHSVFAATAMFPHVLNLPSRVQPVMVWLAIGYPIFWFVSYVCIALVAILVSERESHIFKAAALFELDLRRDDEIARIRKLHSEVAGIRKLSKQYDELEIWLKTHDLLSLFRLLL